MTKNQSSNPFTAGFDQTRKLEILGIFVMALAALLSLSILSYHDGDYDAVRLLDTGALLTPDSGIALTVKNWLGVMGAHIAHLLVFTLFGYGSLMMPVLIGTFGWFIFRQKDLAPLPWFTVYVIALMLVLSVTVGWFHTQYDVPGVAWTGSFGIASAVFLQNFLGVVGSIVLLFVLLLVAGMMVVNRDLQSLLDSLGGVGDSLRGWMEERKDAAAERKDVAAKRKAARREEAERRKVEAASAEVARSAEAKREDAERRKQATEKEAAMEKAGVAGSGSGTGASSVASAGVAGAPFNESGVARDGSPTDGADASTRNHSISDLADDKASNSDDGADASTRNENEADEIEVNVIIGEEEEEARRRELEKANKQQAKETSEPRYKFPGTDLLDSPPEQKNEADMEEINRNKRIILDKFAQHKIEILSVNAIVGPTVTLYELEPAPNVKISKIESYANDIKMATAVHGLRMIAPIPGRSAVGIEVPNKTRVMVFIQSMIKSKKFAETDFELPVAFGKTIENEIFLIDLTKMPHLLMAGATGSGKSVGINTIITCLLYKCHPDNLKFVLVDPKKIELSLYRNIQNAYLAVLPGAEEPIVTDTSEALRTLQSVTAEMDERYDLLKMAMVRDLKAYNRKFRDGELDEELGHRHLPYIVVVIDELADLMMTAGKQIEEPIARLAQLARAIGIHLVVATQRPSVNVITGTIKANFPARIAYQVASKVDSRTILDTGGADQLIGKGDMLFTNGAGMTRIQNAFVSTEEVERVAQHIGNQTVYKRPFLLPEIEDENSEGGGLDDIDDLFVDAAKVVVLHQQGSVSLLQRKLKIGYNRAGRIIDQLFSAGIVGPYQGSTAREVRAENEEELQEMLDDLGLS